MRMGCRFGAPAGRVVQFRSIFVLSALLFAATTHAQSTPENASTIELAHLQNQFRTISNRVSPSVVAISAVASTTQDSDDAVRTDSMNGDKLEGILKRLRSIPHIEFVRIGTRVPIFLPQRITPELCAMLSKYHPLWMSVHVNHPRELTIEVKQALERLANAGIPLGNQSVLLAGVNDDVETMKTLVQKLLLCRVRPYYLYQCDLITGSAHLRSSVAKGIEIIEALRGHTTGYGVPQFVIDAPGGGGKVPINPGYVLYHDNEKIVIRNYEGKIFEYPESGGDQSVQFAPQREYHDEYLYS